MDLLRAGFARFRDLAAFLEAASHLIPHCFTADVGCVLNMRLPPSRASHTSG